MTQKQLVCHMGAGVALWVHNCDDDAATVRLFFFFLFFFFMSDGDPTAPPPSFPHAPSLRNSDDAP
jgi:hypothetical protein